MGRRWSNLITIKMKTTMKRSLYFAAALAIVGAVSCNKELVDNSTPEVPEAKLATLTATIGEPGTKTSLATPENAHVDGSKTYWCAEDAISVFDGSSNMEYTIKDSESYLAAEEAVFEGEELDAEATEFFALYPYTETAEVADGVVKGAVLPAEQTAVEGNLPEGAALAVAYSTDKSTLYFKNVATTIGFTLTEAAAKVEFVAKGGESIAGTIDITYDGENAPTYTVQAEKGNNTVTLNNLEAGTYFFTILPDVTLSQGYELKIDGYTAKTGAVGKKLERSMVYSLGEVEILMTTIYLIPGPWAEANPVFTVSYDENTTQMNKTGEGYFAATLPSSVQEITFQRRNPSDTDSIWNSVENVTLPSDENVYFTIDNTWNNGAWGAKPADKVFSIVGAFNDWGNNGDDIPLEKVSDGLYAAKSVTQLTAFSDWKIRVNKDWAESYSSSITGIEANKWVPVDGSGNTSVASDGTYDIYFDFLNNRIYVMESGSDYSVATQQTESTTPPPTGVPVEANHIYLRPSANWLDANAHFAAWVWKDNGAGKVYNLTKHSSVSDIYELENTGGWNKIIFIRLDPNVTVTDGSTSFPSNKWTQTNDLDINGNLYTVSGWDAGSFSTVEEL